MQFTGPAKAAGSKESAEQLQNRYALLIGLRPVSYTHLTLPTKRIV